MDALRLFYAKDRACFSREMPAASSVRLYACRYSLLCCQVQSHSLHIPISINLKHVLTESLIRDTYYLGSSAVAVTAHICSFVFDDVSVSVDAVSLSVLHLMQ